MHDTEVSEIYYLQERKEESKSCSPTSDRIKSKPKGEGSVTSNAPSDKEAIKSSSSANKRLGRDGRHVLEGDKKGDLNSGFSSGGKQPSEETAGLKVVTITKSCCAYIM